MSTPVLPEQVKCLSGLTPDEVPAPIVAAVVKVIDLLPDDFAPLGWSLSDERHGDVTTPGAYCLALEGAYEWPFRTTEHFFVKGITTPGVFLEAGAGWWLGLYLDPTND